MFYSILQQKPHLQAQIYFFHLFSILQWIPTRCKKDQSNYNDLWGPKIYLCTILSSSAHLAAAFQCVFTSWGTAGSVCIHNILLPHLKTKTSEPVSLSAKLSKSCPNKFLVSHELYTHFKSAFTLLYTSVYINSIFVIISLIASKLDF